MSVPFQHVPHLWVTLLRCGFWAQNCDHIAHFYFGWHWYVCTILGNRKPKTTLADWDDFLNPNGTYCAILQQFFFVGTLVVEYVKLWVLHKKPLSIMWHKVIKKELSLKRAYFLRYILLFSYIFCICSTGSKRRIWALRFCPLYLPVIHNILLQVTLLL